MRHLIYAPIFIVLAGCTSPLKITRLSDLPVDPSDRTFVLNHKTGYDTELREALAKSKFKTKKYASVGIVTDAEKRVSAKGEQLAGSTYEKAEARYGLSLDWSGISPCLFNSNVRGNFKLEVSDLRENEVLFVIEKGGYSGPCGGLGEITVFQDLATELDKLWSPHTPASPRP